MIRKFYVNMPIKGQIKWQLQSNIDLVKFYKTKNKSVQILEFDEEVMKNYFKNNYEICFLHLLGIDKYNSYKNKNLMREILKEDIKEDYKAIYSNQIKKETEKAYFIKGLDAWIPKSQCILKNDILYIKEWLFFKKLFY